MITKHQKDELNRTVKESFSISGVFKNWYAARYGNTAGVRDLYLWAAENDLLITRFNEIPKSQSLVLVITPRGADYLTFEVETADGRGEKRGFQVALIISIFNISAVEKEVGLDALKFDKSFRLAGGEKIEITD